MTALFRVFPRLSGAALVLLVAMAVVLVNPRGFVGGGWDEGRYVETIVAWSQHGPLVGQHHWALRWPLVLGEAAAVKLFGLSRLTLMVPPVIAYCMAGLLLFAFANRTAGPRAAVVAAVALLTVPEIGYWATLVYADTLEMLFWGLSLAAFWIGTEPGQRKSTLWLIGAGFGAALAWSVRETSIGLLIAYGVGFLRAYRMPRLRYMVMAVGFLPVILTEYAIYGVVTGDWLYRVHVDMNHAALGTPDLIGGATRGESLILNTEVMHRWVGYGPVRLHWALDPYINLFASPYYGLVFDILAVAWIAWRWGGGDGRRSSMSMPTRALLPALATLAACNFLSNLYLINVNPGPRMFLPAIMAGCLAIGLIYADGASRWLRRMIVALLAIKFLATLVIADVAPDFRRLPAIAAQVTAPVDGPIHVNPLTRSHLELADSALRSRLSLAPVPVGGYYLAVGTPEDAAAPDRTAPDPALRWQEVSTADTGQEPWTVRLLAPPLHALGLLSDFRFPAVEVRLYRRIG